MKENENNTKKTFKVIVNIHPKISARTTVL